MKISPSLGFLAFVAFSLPSAAFLSRNCHSAPCCGIRPSIEKQCRFRASSPSTGEGDDTIEKKLGLNFDIGGIASSISDGDDEIVEVFYVDDASALQAVSDGSSGGEGGGPTLGGQPLEEVIAEWERNKGAAAAAEAKSQAAAEAELDAMAAAMFAEDEDDEEEDGDDATARIQQAASSAAESPQSRMDDTLAVNNPKGSLRRSSQRAPAAPPPPPASLFSAGWSVGIDLGTTNSAVAAMVNGEPTILSHPNFNGGSRTVPSVVAFGPDGAVLVGQSAANKRTARQKRALDNRLIGDTGDVADGTIDTSNRGTGAGAEAAASGLGSSANEWAVFSSIKRVIGRSAAAAREAGEDLGLLGAAPESMRLKHLLQTARLQELKATAAEATRAKGGASSSSSSSSAPGSSSPSSPTAAATAAAAAAVAVQGKGAEPVVLACPPRRSKTSATATGAGEGSAAASSNAESEMSTEGCLLPEEVSAEVVRSLLATAKAALEGMNLPPPGGVAPTTTGGGGGKIGGAGSTAVGINSAAVVADTNKFPVNIPRAVITVPAYFSPAQCAATEQAGLAAGLQRVRLLKEPEAAALAYGLGTQGQAGKENELVLVFDLGGGTLDVSVLEVGGGVIEVVATSGDGHLGGDDFDDVIAELWAQQLMDAQKTASSSRGGGGGSSTMAQQLSVKSSSSSSSSNAKLKLSFSARLALRRLAEKAKCALSRSAVVQVALHPADFGLASEPTSGGGGESELFDESPVRSRVLESGEDAATAAREGCLIVELTHASFAQATNHLLRRVMTPIRECALMAGVLLPGDVGAAADEAVAEQLQAQKLLQQQLQQEQKQKQRQQQGQRAASDTAGDVNGAGKEVGAGNGGALPTAGSDEFWEALETTGGVAALKKQQQKARAGAKKRQKAGRKEREAFAQAAQQQAKAVAAGEKKKDARKARQMPSGNAKGSDRMRPFPMGKAVDVVILVGGATRMPAIRSLLRSTFGVEPRRTVDPDEAVALGAAVLCGMMDGDSALENFEVMNPFQAALMRAIARRQLELEAAANDDDEDEDVDV